MKKPLTLTPVPEPKPRLVLSPATMAECMDYFQNMGFFVTLEGHRGATGWQCRIFGAWILDKMTEDELYNANLLRVSSQRHPTAYAAFHEAVAKLNKNMVEYRQRVPLKELAPQVKLELVA